MDRQTIALDVCFSKPEKTFTTVNYCINSFSSSFLLFCIIHILPRSTEECHQLAASSLQNKLPNIGSLYMKELQNLFGSDSDYQDTVGLLGSL